MIPSLYIIVAIWFIKKRKLAITDFLNQLSHLLTISAIKNCHFLQCNHCLFAFSFFLSFFLPFTASFFVCQNLEIVLLLLQAKERQVINPTCPLLPLSPSCTLKSGPSPASSIPAHTWQKRLERFPTPHPYTRSLCHQDSKLQKRLLLCKIYKICVLNESVIIFYSNINKSFICSAECM